MLDDPVSTAADREARNESLIEIDEAWELCRDAVDLARISLEESLEGLRSTFEAEQRRIAEGHEAGLEAAWGAYKAAIAGPPAPNRRQLLGEARSSYKQAADTIRSEYEQSMSAALGQYRSARNEARAAYSTAVERAFALHREASKGVPGYFDAGAGTSPGSPAAADGAGGVEEAAFAAAAADTRAALGAHADGGSSGVGMDLAAMFAEDEPGPE